MNWKTSDVDGLYIFIFLENMVWILGFIGNLHNDECLIYIFTGDVENGTQIIFNEIMFWSSYKELRNHFSPIMINTSHKNINGKISRSGVIYPETINTYDLYYQCSKQDPDCLFCKLIIKNFNDEPNFSN